MVNNVIGVVNYVIAARPSLLNYVIADSHGKRAWSAASAQSQANLYANKSASSVDTMVCEIRGAMDRRNP